MEMIKNYFFGMPARLAFARSLLSLEFLVEVLYISPIHMGLLVPLLLEGVSRVSRRARSALRIGGQVS